AVNEIQGQASVKTEIRDSRLGWANYGRTFYPPLDSQFFHDLQGCHLTDAGCVDLAAFLRTNQSLTKLELSDNELGDVGRPCPSSPWLHLLC
uniref:Uncharacterized protein n=1 Tax=Chelonoidis abingdonii TaxID=106734 RepID=A0A8C0J173_CHEAB